MLIHFLLVTIPKELINPNCSRTSEKIKWLVITLLAMDMKSNHFSQSALLNNKCIILCWCTTLYLVCHKSEPPDPPHSHLLNCTFTFIITPLNKTTGIYNCTMANPGPSFGQINHNNEYSEGAKS